jgi:hypothetical protein
MSVLLAMWKQREQSMAWVAGVVNDFPLHSVCVLKKMRNLLHTFKMKNKEPSLGYSLPLVFTIVSLSDV